MSKHTEHLLSSERRLGRSHDGLDAATASGGSGSREVQVDIGDLRSAARVVARAAFDRADSCDYDGAYPVEDVRLLHHYGLLDAPFRPPIGGDETRDGASDLAAILSIIGRGSLPLGRLFEGHVNAVSLVRRYGSAANLKILRAEAQAGRLSGVWMAGEALRLERDGMTRYRLSGRKILCSGAGHICRPLVAADFEDGSILMLPRVDERDRADASGWRSHGMRATATGTVDFEGLSISEDEIVGQSGDYLRPPYFRGGAWRVLAVQLGGLEAIMTCYRDQLRTSPHAEHPLQLARFGEARIALETARLWVSQAAQTAEGPVENPAAVDAYVDLARNAFEGAALRLISYAEKALGLNVFLRRNAMERLIRDLRTYLRQPALDVSLMSAAAFHLRQESAVKPAIARA